jgi:hypothetical protein
MNRSEPRQRDIAANGITLHITEMGQGRCCCCATAGPSRPIRGGATIDDEVDELAAQPRPRNDARNDTTHHACLLRWKTHYLGCDRNMAFHSFSNSAGTAGGGEPINVDLPFCTTLP